MKTIEEGKRYFSVDIEEWMITELNLGKATLFVFALIYGMCERSHLKFYANQQYIMDALHLSKGTVNSSLKALTEKGYLIKVEESQNGFIKKYSYKVNIEKIDTYVDKKGREYNLPHKKSPSTKIINEPV